jgi:hypothetical protein
VILHKVDPALLAGVLDLVEQVANEFLTMDNDTYTHLIYAKAQIKEMLATSNRNAGHSPKPFQFSLTHHANVDTLDVIGQFFPWLAAKEEDVWTAPKRV